MNILGFIVNIVILLAAVSAGVYLLILFSIAIAEEYSKEWKRNGKSYADDNWKWKSKSGVLRNTFNDSHYSGISGNAFTIEDD